jgi:phosphatidylethanolamine/phosphatidyl-N-methylethanolamine N-methyltransferase
MAGMRNKPEFWDRVASVYDVFVNVINAKTHKTLQAHIRQLFTSADIVLECACGTGMLTEIVAPECQQLIATDFSKNMLRKAEIKCKNHGNICFMFADILNLDFEDNAFDKVLAANVIHLLDEPLKALRELVRVCRSGGKIIIPTYLSKQSSKRENVFAKIVGNLGAGFKQNFSFTSYQQFFIDTGYPDALHIRIEGFIPCSIAVIQKKS